MLLLSETDRKQIIDGFKDEHKDAGLELFKKSEQIDRDQYRKGFIADVMVQNKIQQLLSGCVLCPNQRLTAYPDKTDWGADCKANT